MAHVILVLAPVQRIGFGVLQTWSGPLSLDLRPVGTGHRDLNLGLKTVYAPLSSVYTKPPLPCRHVRWLGSSVHIAPTSHDPGLTRPGPRQCQYPPPRELRAEVFIHCHPPRCQKPQHFNYCCEQHELRATKMNGFEAGEFLAITIFKNNLSQKCQGGN